MRDVVDEVPQADLPGVNQTDWLLVAVADSLAISSLRRDILRVKIVRGLLQQDGVHGKSSFRGSFLAGTEMFGVRVRGVGRLRG